MRELQSFHAAFEITRSIVFEVSYYRLGSNKNKYFTTSAAQFNRPKSDFNHCGQVQKELLKGHPVAMRFFNKWDKFHLLDLNEEQHTELLSDLNRLFDAYNSLYRLNDSCFGFSELKELSKNKIK